MKIGIKYIYIFVFSVSLMSCEIGSFDDIKPQNKLTEETTFTDAGKVEAALNGVYASWRDWGIVYTPGNIISLSGLYSYSFSSDYDFNIVDYEDYDLTSYYTLCYNMIQESNFLIYALQNNENISGLSDFRRKEIEGEARLHRGMTYFQLLERFGQFYDINSELGLSYTNQPIRELVTLERMPVKQVYDSILVDLDFAIANAPAVNVNYRLSQITAKALKAKVLLYMQNYTDAASTALEVMGDVNYKLEDTYAEIFAKGYESREVLFSPFSRTWDEQVSVYLGDYWMPAKLTEIADAEVPDLPGTYDKRYEFSHVNVMPPARMGKYPLVSYSDGQKSNSFFVMRMAEVYLIYAEAKARAEADANIADADAINALNAIRARAVMPDKAPATKAELLEAIRIEKILELNLEWSQPWFDLVRYTKWDGFDITSFKATITSDDQLVLPLPKKALVGNNKLVQNPGYPGVN